MTPRFLLDGMLGSLARWLRIGGYDAEYLKDTPDDDLMERAVREDRILLTRDEALVKRTRKRGVESIYIKNEGDEAALAQLTAELGITFYPTLARCPKCNHTVEKIPKAEVADRVPGGTYNSVEDFWACPKCGSVYWRGSHWPKIVETLGGTGRGA